METNERMAAILSHYNLTINEFVARTGIKTKQAVYDILHGKTKSISPAMESKIISCFPSINRAWLLTGDGKMLIEPSPPIDVTVSPTGTPVYDVDSTMGTDSRPMEFLQEHIIGYVNMPNISKNAAIIRANGDSMTPVINDGNFIAVREITDFDDIFYGQIYLVVTAQNRMVKYVRKNKDDEKNYVILRSANKEYDDILMPKAKILKMFIVENILSLAVR